MIEAQLPDGTILEFPDGTSQDVIQNVVKKQLSTKKEVGGLEGVLRSANQGLTFGFGDELIAGVGAIPTALMTDMSIPESYEALLNQERGLNTQFQEESPYLAGGSEIAGGVASGVGGGVSALRGLGKVAPNVLQGLSKLATGSTKGRLASASGLGALEGSIYGFGTGEGDGKERGQRAAETGLISGALAPLGASAVSALTRLGQRAFGNSGSQASQELQKVLSPEQADLMRTGQVLRLTEGQATQDPTAQALESMGRSGALGEEAQSMALQNQYRQQDDIQKALQSASGGQLDESLLAQSAGDVRSKYRQMKKEVDSAYNDASAIRQVIVDKKPITQAFVPRVNDILYKQGFDASSLTPESKKILGELNSGALKDAKVTGINLEKMEFWRRKLTNRAEQLRGDPEGRVLTRIRESYDDFMDKLPTEALKSGDENAISLINNARALRRKQGVLFERNKQVRNIVQNEDLTNEELANIIVSGSSRGNSFNAGSGKLVKDLKRATGNEEEFVDGLRRGTMARILNRSMSRVQRSGEDINLIDSNKLQKEIDTLLGNKSYLNEIFDKEQQKTLTALNRDLKKIASQQPGSVNYSNTAYTLLRALQNLPLGLSAASGVAELGLKPLASRAARKELEKSLDPVLTQALEELSGAPRYYGALGTGVIGAIQGETNESN